MPLSDDDRQWLSGQLTTLSGHAGNVKNELGAVRNDLGTITNELETIRVELSVRLEKLETSLLTEFHKWASPVEMRQRSHAAALRALDAEVEALGDRIKGLEGS